MRVGLVIDGFDPRRGGVEQWTWQFVQQLLGSGHEVHVVAGQFAPGTERVGLFFHRVPISASRTAWAGEVEKTLRGLKLDLIHDTGCGWHCDVFQPHGGSRVASFEQNLLLIPSWMRPFKRRAAAWLPRYQDFRRLTARQYGDRERIFLAISQMVAGHLQRYHGVREEQLRLVYNGVDLARFSPDHRATHRQAVRERLEIRDDEVLLLIVAHNFRLKGVPTLLRAVGRLRREGAPVRLVVAGGKRHRSYLELARKVGAGEATTFVGAVEDSVPYYAAADVYVQPTFYDPCSLVLLEALASGLPVVTSRFNGAGELLDPGVQGSLVDDPADVAELASHLRPLLPADVRERMGTAARALAMNHSLQRNCREVLAVYEEAAGRRRKAA
jgi:UDP-glucose:(heptosyl)LPS alpha-1,3-glucosyltransferase